MRAEDLELECSKQLNRHLLMPCFSGDTFTVHTEKDKCPHVFEQGLGFIEINGLLMFFEVKPKVL